MSDVDDQKKDEKSPQVAAVPTTDEQAPAASPKMILKELEKTAASGPALPVKEPPDAHIQPQEALAQTPLVTDAMRRLDELLARFRK